MSTVADKRFPGHSNLFLTRQKTVLCHRERSVETKGPKSGFDSKTLIFFKNTSAHPAVTRFVVAILEFFDSSEKILTRQTNSSVTLRTGFDNKVSEIGV